MLIASGDGPTGPVAILGLDAVNVERLKAGQPIVKEMAQFGCPNLTIIIMYGETLDAVQAEIEKHVKLPPAKTYEES